MIRKTGNFCLLMVVVFLCAACGKQDRPKLIDPVQRADGLAYVPMRDTAFLVPEKTWLKSYSRSAVDGRVSHLTLHAKAPEIVPWSQELNERMYPKLGWGEALEAEIRDTGREGLRARRFQYPPRFGGENLVPDENAKEPDYPGLLKYTSSSLPDLLGDFYVHMQDQQVIFFVRCSNSPSSPAHHCDLQFPWNEWLEVSLVFNREFLPHSIEMADRVKRKLREFEIAGEAYRNAINTGANR